MQGESDDLDGSESAERGVSSTQIAWLLPHIIDESLP